MRYHYIVLKVGPALEEVAGENQESGSNKMAVLRIWA
jgi:hypothetical protein